LELGFNYLNGLAGKEKDLRQAVSWYRKAADQADPKAQFALGSLYEYGLGVDRDLDQAKAWYQKAASRANTDAVAALKRLEALRSIDVLYWGKRADYGIVEKALAPYKLRLTRNECQSYQGYDFSKDTTDTVTCSEDVPIDAVRTIALALFDAGVHLSSIGPPDQNNASIRNTIIIESTNNASPILLRKKIEQLSECPSHRVTAQ
jgi:tetratricopeptide (TPR) repeat protein